MFVYLQPIPIVIKRCAALRVRARLTQTCSPEEGGFEIRTSELKRLKQQRSLSVNVR